MIKRLFDIFASAIGLIVLSPLFLVIAVLVRLKLGSPVFFRQTRPGKDCKPFEMIKFRTMIDAYDSEGRWLPDKERITSLGSFLRASSLDELPELWNVLKGDMSLVGPRPLLMEYLDYYTAEEALRHTVRPGITGLAQVGGRNQLSWEDRLALDVEYVQNQTFFLDISILLRTFKQVLRKDGVQVIPSLDGRKLSDERRDTDV